jgi:hypothetical protein
MPPPLDLSHMAKLKHAEFHFRIPNVRWIVATLETAKTDTLQQITLHSSIFFDNEVSEVIHREWQDMDHLLARLWTSHSIVPEVKSTSRIRNLGFAAPVLLPKLVNMGVVCKVEKYE